MLKVWSLSMRFYATKSKSKSDSELSHRILGRPRLTNPQTFPLTLDHLPNPKLKGLSRLSTDCQGSKKHRIYEKNKKCIRCGRYQCNFAQLSSDPKMPPKHKPSDHSKTRYHLSKPSLPKNPNQATLTKTTTDQFRQQPSN